MDDPRYEGFASEPFMTGGLPPRRRTRNWKKIRLMPGWRPLKVHGRVRRFNDFPGVGLLPAFSERAVNALRDFLEPNGELLPLESSIGSYFAFNCTTIVDAIDLRRSEIKWIIEPYSAFGVLKYELLPDRLIGRTIFHMPETSDDLYVNQTFVDRAQDAGLKGMYFVKVWPIPAGVTWSQLAKAQRENHDAQGLPEGQTVKGNSIVIRVFLNNSKSKGTAGEKKAVDRLMDELDGLLVDIDSEKPVVGSLEGVDYGVAGECRLFLSCPDADALARKLRPWLKSLNWPNEVVVLKRYGNFRDVEAKESVMKL
jgi:hypothetical protein